MSPDDLDDRFNALVSQVEPEQRRPKTTARPSRRRITVAAVAVAAVAVVAVLIAAGGTVAGRLPDLLAAVEAALPTLGPVPEETEPVAGSPEEVGPFEGSKAESYPNGAAGLVMPPAKAMHGLSKKDVAAALKRVKALMAASHLDVPTLMGGRPKAFADLLPPEERAWFRKNLDRTRGFAAKDDFNTRAWVHSFAPKTAELATPVVKVKGKTTLGRYSDAGRTGVKISMSYVFVYAVQRPGQPWTRHRVVSHHVGEAHVYREDGELVVWVYNWNTGGVTPARCDVDDSFVHPFYPDSPRDKVAERATEHAGDPYDLTPEHNEACTISSET
ncbi:hypothetical protein [Nonomuraea dietziae]|uniref:hypothetical protein n=1 Tax=Nonomuraea dietziae TaxID=65515 RepID=UPI003405EEC6